MERREEGGKRSKFDFSFSKLPCTDKSVEPSLEIQLETFLLRREKIYAISTRVDLWILSIISSLESFLRRNMFIFVALEALNIHLRKMRRERKKLSSK